MSNTPRDRRYYDETAKTCTVTFTATYDEDDMTGDLRPVVRQAHRSIDGQQIDTIDLLRSRVRFKETDQGELIWATIDGEETIIGTSPAQ